MLNEPGMEHLLCWFLFATYVCTVKDTVEPTYQDHLCTMARNERNEQPYYRGASILRPLHQVPIAA